MGDHEPTETAAPDAATEAPECSFADVVEDLSPEERAVIDTYAEPIARILEEAAPGPLTTEELIPTTIQAALKAERNFGDDPELVVKSITRHVEVAAHEKQQAETTESIDLDAYWGAVIEERSRFNWQRHARYVGMRRPQIDQFSKLAAEVHKEQAGQHEPVRLPGRRKPVDPTTRKMLSQYKVVAERVAGVSYYLAGHFDRYQPDEVLLTHPIPELTEAQQRELAARLIPVAIEDEVERLKKMDAAKAKSKNLA